MYLIFWSNINYWYICTEQFWNKKLYIIYFIFFNKKLIFDKERIYLPLICLQLNTLILGDVKWHSYPPPFSDFMVWKSDITSLILCTGWKNKGDFFFFVKMSLSQRFGIVLMGWALLSQEHISKVHRTSQIKIFRVLLLSSNYLNMQN